MDLSLHSAHHSTKKHRMAHRAVLLALMVAPSHAMLLRSGGLKRSRASLAAGVRPDAVARLLAKTEDGWKYQAVKCEEGGGSEGKCLHAEEAFGKSCITVVDSVMKGSDGDHDRVQEYMADVCHQRVLTSWHQARCNQLQRSISDAMKFNAFGNRVNFDSMRFCRSFWNEFRAEEKGRAAELKLEQQKRALEAEKRLKARAEQEARRKAAQLQDVDSQDGEEDDNVYDDARQQVKVAMAKTGTSSRGLVIAEVRQVNTSNTSAALR